MGRREYCTPKTGLNPVTHQPVVRCVLTVRSPVGHLKGILVTEDPSSIQPPMLERITNIELSYPPSTKLDLGNGKVALRFDQSIYVSAGMLGEKLIIIATETNEVPQSKQATDVPGDSTD